MGNVTPLIFSTNKKRLEVRQMDISITTLVFFILVIIGMLAFVVSLSLMQEPLRFHWNNKLYTHLIPPSSFK